MSHSPRPGSLVGASPRASTEAVLGVDIGTSSSKGVLVDSGGRILASAVRAHQVDRPAAGCVEMDPRIWWDEFCQLARELSGAAPRTSVVGVGVSGMGPCVALTDADGAPVRPAILYGVDTRATAQIAALTERYGEPAIRRLGGSALSTQAVGPKLAWISEREPDAFHRARRIFMPSSYLVYRLTGEYVLDHHSASQSDPLYDLRSGTWFDPWWSDIAGPLEPPALRWPGEIAGSISRSVAAETGLPPGVPVVTGTIDAWAEAVSVGACRPGDLLLMYGTTMFLIATTDRLLTSPTLWSTVGVEPATNCLAGGMATSGAVTSWLNEIFGDPGFASLAGEAAGVPPGSRGLLVLPYFAGERTPIADPQARGIISGLTVTHTRADLYRAALEGIGLGVRHNYETLRDAVARIDRVIAAGGGTQGGLWTQIVSDATGLTQLVPSHTVGASYGMAYLAACTRWPVGIDAWNPVERVVRPDADAHAILGSRYPDYLELYRATAGIVHHLADTPAVPS